MRRRTVRTVTSYEQNNCSSIPNGCNTFVFATAVPRPALGPTQPPSYPMGVEAKGPPCMCTALCLRAMEDTSVQQA
jgi:hypothetical protein